jgi:hypothetical protein
MHLVINVNTEAEGSCEDTADWQDSVCAVLNCRVCELAIVLSLPDDWSLYIRLGRLSACCTELQSACISDIAVVTGSYVL